MMKKRYQSQMAKTPARMVHRMQKAILHIMMSWKPFQKKMKEKMKIHKRQQNDINDLDTIAYDPEESEEEPFNTAIDDTSEDLTIVMGKPVTTTFVSDDVCISTEKVGCLQVTSKLQEFLNHFPPEFKEKALEQIYEILQVLDAY